MHKHKTILLCLESVVVVSSAVLQLPISHPKDTNLYTSTDHGTSLGLPVKSMQSFLYTTNITIGTPPQTFSLAIDTTSNGLFVPSVTCEDNRCDYRQEQGYNSSRSSTHKVAGRRAIANWGAVYYRGFLSRDTIRLGDVSVTDYLFEEWTSASCYSFGCLDGGYDGVLGLSPPWDADQGQTPNILSTLLEQDAPDEPIFAMKLPVGLYDEGDFSFGAMNRQLNSSGLIELPVINVTSNPTFSNAWTVPASHITLDSRIPLEYTLPEHGYALLDSGTQYLILPSELSKNLTAAIGATFGAGPFAFIPCSVRQELPSLKFTLAGHNFSISAFEYTLEVHPSGAPDDTIVCITSFMPAYEFGLGENWNGIVLGSPFLRGFYSVWDFEKRKVGLAELA